METNVMVLLETGSLIAWCGCMPGYLWQGRRDGRYVDCLWSKLVKRTVRW
jgi:hypothetical protein